MSQRIDYLTAAPGLLGKLKELEDALRASGLETSLYELVKIRASQINGCAYCLHMHTRDARAAGEREERIHLLPAWRESSYYSPRERSALAWTEALTRVHEVGAPDELWTALREQFSDAEIVALTMLIGTINQWNRIAIGFGSAHPANFAKAG